MGNHWVTSHGLYSNAERDRERKRMDRIITLRALLIEAGAVGLLLFSTWLILTIFSPGAS
jgi:hypothetical protein